ncbi:class I SAM-dependent methyltransferase [Streptomyces sp. NPDC059786]|uniref:class I SAM-dependent methyltransferase n=1 Tax=Streptomyces sp. NPDC059786 TaxID=3346946 RepID=UPI0036628A9C
MPDGWQWDPTLFRGSAAYYERGRLPYAPGFAGTLAGALGATGSDRLLDVGCGPGIVTLAAAPYFAEVTGMDPDADMLAEAERRAARHGVANARWVTGRAEDLPAGLGAFRAVVFAQSFHWTDRERVAAAVRRMLAPSGAFVHISDLKDPPPVAVPSARPAPPYERIGGLVRRYLGPVRRAGQGTLVGGTPGGEDLVLRRAGFVHLERHVVPAGAELERTADDLVAWAFSRSDAAPHLFGDRLADFEGELRALLREASPDDCFAEQPPPTEIKIWRPANGG